MKTTESRRFEVVPVAVQAETDHWSGTKTVRSYEVRVHEGNTVYTLCRTRDESFADMIAAASELQKHLGVLCREVDAVVPVLLRDPKLRVFAARLSVARGNALMVLRQSFPEGTVIP